MKRWIRPTTFQLLLVNAIVSFCAVVAGAGVCKGINEMVCGCTTANEWKKRLNNREAWLRETLEHNSCLQYELTKLKEKQ